MIVGIAALHVENDEHPQGQSLWYIFNTLDGPSPNVNVKEPWSRRAMDDPLSDEDFSDLGLTIRDTLYHDGRSRAYCVGLWIRE